MKCTIRKLIFTLAVIIFAGNGIPSAFAQGVLRDAETERFLNDAMRPLFEAAGIDPNAMVLLLLADRTMNAAAGGRYIVVNSGTILELEDINQLLGVLAHETGHIAGGHSVRRQEGAGPATALALISMLLGAAAIAAGAPDAGVAVMMGGQGSAQRLFLAHSRVQEAAADQAAIDFLERTQTSALGLVQTFEKFRDQEYMLQVSQDPYIRTHPLSSERVARLRDQAAASPYYNKPADADLQLRYQRIRAKLGGYLNLPRITLQEYPESDHSMIARYARIYAYNKNIEWEKALADGKSLIEDYPDDPYFNEIVGQIYLENGMVRESLPYYRRANELLPHEPMILTSLGHALVALEEPEADKEAIEDLELAAELDNENDLAWRQLAIAYARNGREPEASHATAEMFLLHQRMADAAFHAQRAVKGLPYGTPKWVRSQDILVFAQAAMEEQKSRR